MASNEDSNNHLRKTNGGTRPFRSVSPPMALSRNATPPLQSHPDSKHNGNNTPQLVKDKNDEKRKHTPPHEEAAEMEKLREEEPVIEKTEVKSDKE